MMRILSLIVLIFLSSCKLDVTTKLGASKSKSIIENRSVIASEFYDLSDSTLHCPHKTFASYEFLPQGLQFFCTVHEKDIRFTFTTRDTTIYKDPCFEFFLDPGADGLEYYEFQFNACPAVWDLKLKTSKGRINAPANVEEWDIGTNWEIKRIGTYNDASDEDRLWSVYGVIPWKYFSGGSPRKGETWSYNFMRVDYSEDNEPSYWAAYPTAKEMIHYPELWPTITF